MDLHLGARDVGWSKLHGQSACQRVLGSDFNALQLHTVPHLMVGVLATHPSRYKTKMQVEENQAGAGTAVHDPCRANCSSLIKEEH